MGIATRRRGYKAAKEFLKLKDWEINLDSVWSVHIINYIAIEGLMPHYIIHTTCEKAEVCPSVCFDFCVVLPCSKLGLRRITRI